MTPCWKLTLFQPILTNFHTKSTKNVAFSDHAHSIQNSQTIKMSTCWKLTFFRPILINFGLFSYKIDKKCCIFTLGSFDSEFADDKNEPILKIDIFSTNFDQFPYKIDQKICIFAACSIDSVRLDSKKMDSCWKRTFSMRTLIHFNWICSGSFSYYVRYIQLSSIGRQLTIEKNHNRWFNACKKRPI